MAQDDAKNEVESLPSGGYILLPNQQTLPGYTLVSRIRWTNNENYLGIATGSWSAIPPAEVVRQNHTAIWNNTFLTVWGGHTIVSGFYTITNTGAAFNPATNTWAVLPLTGAVPTARYGHTAIHYPLYDEMVVWGGTSTSSPVTPLNTGSHYSFIENDWNISITTTGAPTARYDHTAVSRGDSMFVWGGRDGAGNYFANGGIFDMNTLTWRTPMAAPPAAIAGRSGHFACWTGTKMLIWGGTNASGALSNGGLYDPATNSWTEIPVPGFLTYSTGASCVWTGTEMIVVNLQMQARYNPTTNTWQELPDPPAGWILPGSAKSAWTGTEAFFTGGIRNFPTSFTFGFDPATNQWKLHQRLLSDRVNHTATWCGTQLITFGGSATGNIFSNNTGERFNPAGSFIYFDDPIGTMTLYLYQKN